MTKERAVPDMFLARIIRGCKPSVMRVSGTVPVVCSNGQPVAMMRREMKAWRLKGEQGAAAISDTPYGAIGAAKLILETAGWVE